MFEDLFTAPVQGRKWIDGVSAECRQFCEELADEIIRRGREPSWMATLRLIKERFPQDAFSR